MGSAPPDRPIIDLARCTSTFGPLYGCEAEIHCDDGSSFQIICYTREDDCRCINLGDGDIGRGKVDAETYPGATERCVKAAAFCVP